MKTIHINFHYKNLLFFIIILSYVCVLTFYVVPSFHNWDFLPHFKKIATLSVFSMWVAGFPLFFQFSLKVFVSLTHKGQQLRLNENEIILPDFYIHFWSLDMKKEASIPYGAIKLIKFAEIPNPLFPQKIVSIIYQLGDKEKRIGFCDNQFSRGIIDYQMAFDFLKNKTQIEVLDNTLHS